MKVQFEYQKDCARKLKLVGYHVVINYSEGNNKDGMIVKYDKEGDLFLIYMFHNKELIKFEPEAVEEYFERIHPKLIVQPDPYKGILGVVKIISFSGWVSRKVISIIRKV